MLSITDTPRHAGVILSGDYHDLNQLYDALHHIVGEEGQFPASEGSRLRVLGLCYDIRHAFMGDRDVHFVDNGLTDEKKKFIGILAPNQNVYYSFKYLWPEVLFIMIVLNDFISTAERMGKIGVWDPAVTTIRNFQGTLTSCIRETVAETVFIRMIKSMNQRFVSYDHYCVQYLDVLTDTFLRKDPEKRLKFLSTLAKRIAEKDRDYYQVEMSVRQAALKYDCSPLDIRIGDRDDDAEIDW